LIDRVSHRHNLPAAEPYRPLDTARTADWLLGNLKRFRDHPVEAIIPVAHGAAIAGLRDGAPAFAPPDYEWAIPEDKLAAYRAARDPFSLTGSPALPGGLNLGSQLAYLETVLPDGLDRVILLPYAQYWAWLLSGVAVSEVTSLGCHTDLWDPAAGVFSPLAQRRGWAARFAPLAHAGEAIGTLRPDIARRTGLSPLVRVHAGLHDSNAALIAARAVAGPDDGERTVLATGTWFVAMRSSACVMDPALLPEARDCLVNVDVAGAPVPSARFMGGRELECLDVLIERPGLAGLDDVLASGAMALPSLVGGSGPFPDHRHRWIAEPTDVDARTTAAALYAALMEDASLDLIGARDTLIVEGRFAAAEIFVRALAALRPDTRVLAIAGEIDASFGALLLIAPEARPAVRPQPVEPLPADLQSYRARWRAALAASA
jgi:sugar (pentulose or hexulose) kinase